MNGVPCRATAVVIATITALGFDPRLASAIPRGDDPYADVVIDYDPGDNPAPGYTNPASVPGAPERFTGEGIFPSVVSPFSPPYGLDEIVSIGANGSLVVRFDTPVTDDPANPGGVDLLVFGNSGFIDASFPGGVVGGVFGDDGGMLEVSADCVNWVLIRLVEPDGLMPTLGYLDAGPYDAVPGVIESDFTRPPPRVRLGELLGLDLQELLAIYDGSGGGACVDLAGSGLAAITCVRLSNSGDPGVTPAIEIDALADVAPAPGMPADLDRDGAVGITDLLILLAAWGACDRPCPADLDGSGAVAIGDLLILLASWTT